MSTTTRGFTVATSVELVTEECCTCDVSEPIEAVLDLTPPLGYVVVHEWDLGGEMQYDTAGSLQRRREPAETQLAYCHGMQERKRPGSEGRYFIAAVYEDTPLEEITDVDR